MTMRKNMKMKLFTPTNIAEKLQLARTTDTAMINAVNTFIARPNTINSFDLEAFETKNIYHLDTIKSTCIDYRLRFLDIKYFKNDLPQEAFDKIAALEATAQHYAMRVLKIMAPSKLFRLKKHRRSLVICSHWERLLLP